MGKLTIWHEMKLANGTTADIAQVDQPHRPPTIESDILVPAAEAAISGLILGCAATALATWLAHLPWWPTLPAAIAILTGIAWIAALREERQTLWHTEEIQLLQPQTPTPPAPSVPLLANPNDSHAAVRQIQDHHAQDANRTHLIQFVRNCATVGTSESAQGVKPAQRAQYVADRDALLALGLARWRQSNRRTGWELAVPPADAVVILRRHVLD